MAALILGSFIFLLSFLILLRVLPFAIRAGARALGWYMRRKTQYRRDLFLSRIELNQTGLASDDLQTPTVDADGWEEVKAHSLGSAPNGANYDDEWKGIIGFFHPFCNAGGGGERVLWAAIRATQQKWPAALCMVYTGDHDVSKDAMLQRVKDRFNIHLHAPTIHFLYLSTRHYVLSSTWPHFTLLGQSLGSVILAYDAFSLLVPDVFIDTMGYSFALAFSKLLFPSVPTGAYVHYPTISTDMLGSLDKDGQGLNAGTGAGWKGAIKRRYWNWFARVYSWAGGEIDIVMTNSSWTQSHIHQLWGPVRQRRKRKAQISVVFPPVAVEELQREVDVSAESERQRRSLLLCIAQFRPEKNHQLILEAFAELLRSKDLKDVPEPTLVLLGSVRDSDDATRVYKLRLLAHELKIKDRVEFICDATWPQILDWLRKSSIGVNGMWNEHFGIGVVEYQAAGLISVVHDSGGPKEDIVVDVDGKPTGFHATTSSEYASCFLEALKLGPNETLAMRLRARESARRFTETEFAANWVKQTGVLLGMQAGRRTTG